MTRREEIAQRIRGAIAWLRANEAQPTDTIISSGYAQTMDPNKVIGWGGEPDEPEDLAREGR